MSYKNISNKILIQNVTIVAVGIVAMLLIAGAILLNGSMAVSAGTYGNSYTSVDSADLNGSNRSHAILDDSHVTGQQALLGGNGMGK